MTREPEPLVSVVLATSGTGRYINDQLESLAAQVEPPPYELLLVANRTSFDPDALIARWRDRLPIRLVRADSRAGSGFARNVGVRAARGRILLFVDDDDTVNPEYVAEMADALVESDAVGARIDLTRLNSGWRQHIRSVAQAELHDKGPLAFAYTATLGVRRDVFETVGPFDERLDSIAGEDIEWCLRLRKMGLNLELAPLAVVHYRFRTRYRDLWRQGFRYGRAAALIEPEWTGWGGWLSNAAGQARLVLSPFGRARRRRGWFNLARRVGLVVERRRVRRGSSTPI